MQWIWNFLHFFWTWFEFKHWSSLMIIAPKVFLLFAVHLVHCTAWCEKINYSSIKPKCLINLKIVATIYLIKETRAKVELFFIIKPIIPFTRANLISERTNELLLFTLLRWYFVLNGVIIFYITTTATTKSQLVNKFVFLFLCK